MHVLRILGEGGGWGLLSLEAASHCWNYPGSCFFSGWVCASCIHELPGNRNQTCWSSPSPRAAESPVQSTLGDRQCDVLALKARFKNWRRRIASPPPGQPPGNVEGKQWTQGMMNAWQGTIPTFSPPRQNASPRPRSDHSVLLDSGGPSPGFSCPLDEDFLAFDMPSGTDPLPSVGVCPHPRLSRAESRDWTAGRPSRLSGLESRPGGPFLFFIFFISSPSFSGQGPKDSFGPIKWPHSNLVAFPTSRASSCQACRRSGHRSAGVAEEGFEPEDDDDPKSLRRETPVLCPRTLPLGDILLASIDRSVARPPPSALRPPGYVRMRD